MKLFIGMFLIACVIIFAVFFATSPTRGQKEQKDDATPVTRGQVTEKEKAYAKEYKKLYSYYKGRRFTDLIEESIGLGDTTAELGASVGGHEAFFMPGAPEITLDEFLIKLSCKADAIVLGIVKTTNSRMTEDETFIYTAYDFSIQDILKNNPSFPIKNYSVIDVTRPGGLINLDSRRIRISDLSYDPLQINRSYLLFLKHVTNAEGYMPAAPEGDFGFENGSYFKLGKRPVPKELRSKIRSKELMIAIRRAVLSECKEELKGEDQ